MISFPSFVGGGTESIAALLDDLTEQLRRAGRIDVAPPLEIVQHGGGPDRHRG